MALAGNELTRMVEVDGLMAAVAALIAIIILLFADFKNIKLTFLTILPLFMSMGSLLGIMVIFDIKFDFINIISIPLLIGIGIDDAVHINHRYLQEGKGNMDKTISATGSAVLLTTLTTIIGFASFIPAIMRAMRSTGIVLTIAMALAFLFSILMHPSMLIIVNEKLGMNIQPFRKK
jgi:predicted RND superfamily exporter protein